MGVVASAAVLIVVFVAVAACSAVLAVRLYRPRPAAGPRRPGDDA